MSDTTAGAGQVYTACKLLFDDLNRLGADYGQAIRDRGFDLPERLEYSYSPQTFMVKRDHVWMSYRDDVTALTFAATYVIFAAGTNHLKFGPPGRPELWFLLGRVTKPKGNFAVAIRDMFMEAERPHFDPTPTVGGTLSHYFFNSAGELWSVLLVGRELGDIDSPAALEQRVVSPLTTAARERSIQL